MWYRLGFHLSRGFNCLHLACLENLHMLMGYQIHPNKARWSHTVELPSNSQFLDDLPSPLTRVIRSQSGDGVVYFTGLTLEWASTFHYSSASSGNGQAIVLVQNRSIEQMAFCRTCNDFSLWRLRTNATWIATTTAPLMASADGVFDCLLIMTQKPGEAALAFLGWLGVD